MPTQTLPTLGIIFKGKHLPVIAFYDNGGQSADRYTAVLSRFYMKASEGYHTCISFSEYPNGPLGVSIFGDCKLGEHLGKNLPREKIPAWALQHIFNRTVSVN